MNIEEIKNKAIQKVQLFLDLNNGDNQLQKDLGWGFYIVYRYLHTEEYFEEIVTFDNSDEAEAYLQSEIDRMRKGHDQDSFLWEDDENDEDEIEDMKRDPYFQLKEWDLPIRREGFEKCGITMGLASAWDFVHTMPVEMALELFSQFFASQIIPGYFEEH